MSCSSPGGSFDLFTLRFGGTHEVTEPFRFTTGRWYNKLRDDGDYAKAPAYRDGFTYADFAYGTDTPEDFVPADAPLQRSLICSPSARFLAVDVDYPDNLPGSAAGEHVSWADAVSTRGGHFHIGIDMRGVPPQDWPAQGRTAWGDVKAAGFIPVPGSLHKSGEPYAAVPGWQEKIIPAAPELLRALKADREEHARRRLDAARTALGLPTGTRLPDGAYLYASGYVSGSWKQLLDAGIQLHHDDELKDLAWDMGVTYGREEAEVRETWTALAGALGRPWTDRDFARHWHKVPARRAEVLENDDALRFEQDFGLRVLPTPLEAEQQRQQQAWEATAGSGVRPPEPPPGWGFEHEGIDYFSLWLGGHVFDAGRPNDADNALAVLARAHNVLRYDEEAGTWLLRGTAKWSAFTGSAGPRAVINGLRSLMPEGCADPVKHPAWEHLDPEENAGEIAALKAQAKNRERFSASSSIGQVAAVMADTVLRHRGAGSVARSSKLDAEREVLWAGGVPWDLRKTEYEVTAGGQVRCTRVVPANLDRDTPHLMTAPVVPDPSRPFPLIEAYCRAVFPDLPPEWGDRPDAGREWALDVFAAAFTGYADAVMPVLLGETRMGKTFLVNLVTSVLGDYGGIMSGELLKADARLHGSFTLKLKGMRLAFVDEAPGKGKASQEHLKKITGGGKLEGNKMRENPVEFFPTHTLVLATNEAPALTDPALRARARMIKFEGDRAAVKAAAAALGGSVESPQWREEMPGFLAHMMARAARWLADRSVADSERAPRHWQSWTDEIVAEQNPVDAWSRCPEVAVEAEWQAGGKWRGTQADTLREHFVAWCRRQGEPVTMDRIQFGLALHALGYTKRKSMGVIWWPLRIVLPGASEWLTEGTGAQGRSPSPIPPTVPPTIPGQNPSSGTVSDVFRDSRDSTHTNNTHTARTHTRTHTQDETGINPSLSLPLSLNPSDLLERGDRDRDTPSLDVPAGEGHPSLGPAAGVKQDNRPENGEKAENGQKPDSPPVAKTRKPRLTDEEKAERAAAKKAELARQRAEAKTAKVAELGGPLVQLPAVVLRDQRILEVDAVTAAKWLEPMLGELSADVEHSGFPRSHKDYRLRLVQVGDEHSAVVLDPSDPAQAEVIRDALRAAQVLHAHSALADLIPLEAAGLGDRTMWDKMRDTLLAAKLTDPALCDSDEAALKPLAKALLGEEYALSWKADERRKEVFAAGGWLEQTEVTTPPERSGWAQVPICEAFVRYAASDVMDCAAVWRVLAERGGR
jgi:hypothetical protein